MAFPSSPQVSIDTKDLLGSFPTGSKVYGYWVSPDKTVFGASAPIPHPTTYVAIAAKLPTAADASAFVAESGKISGMQAITQGGLQGYAFMGSENSSINQGSALTDPAAQEGAMILQSGQAVYEAFAVARTIGEVRFFLTSFQLL